MQEFIYSIFSSLLKELEGAFLIGGRSLKLVSCHIENFGRLRDFDYIFDEGVNVLCEENGWGKSTFASFLCAMFYGLPAGRGTAGRNTGKGRSQYEPWQGGVFGGQVIFEAGGREYLMSRVFGRRASEDGFELRDAVTNLPSFDFSEKVGEELFHLDRESFLRTVFTAQQDCETRATDDVNALIGGLQEQAGDMGSCEEALRRLREAANRLSSRRQTGIMSRRAGKIKVLSQRAAEAEEIEERLERCRSLARRQRQQRALIGEKLRRARKELENAVTSSEEAEKELEEVSLRQDEEGSGKVMSGKAMSGKPMPEKTKSGKEMPGEAAPGKAMPEKAAPGKAMPGKAMPGKAEPGRVIAGKTAPGKAMPGKAMSGEAAPGKAMPGKEIKRDSSPEKNAKFDDRPGMRRSAVAALLLSGAMLFSAGIPLLFFVSRGTGAGLTAVGALFVGFGIFLYYKTGIHYQAGLFYKTGREKEIFSEGFREKSSLPVSEQKREQLWGRMSGVEEAHDSDDSTAPPYIAEMGNDDSGDGKMQLQERRERKLSRKYFECQSRALEWKEKIQELLREDLVCRTALAELKQEAEELEEELETCREDERRLRMLKEEQEEDSRRCRQIEMAAALLQEAKESMTARYADPIRQGFCACWERITGCSAAGIRVDAHSAVTVQEMGRQREIPQLSIGYRDLAGVCLRAALADAMFLPGQSERPPLIFDDPFTNLDDEKLEGALCLLREMGEKYQILYMTCSRSRSGIQSGRRRGEAIV